MSAPKKCIICRVHPPTVPDRERMGRPIKRVCHQCHAKRLLGDLDYCIALERERRLNDCLASSEG